MADAEWYYAKNGETHGPITAQDLRQLAATGQLATDDLVWKKDLANWMPAGRIKGIFAAMVPPPFTATNAKPTATQVLDSATQVFEKYSQLSSGSFLDEILNAIRKQYSPRLLLSLSQSVATWGSYALAVAMLLGPALIVLYAIRFDSLTLTGLAVVVFLLLAILQYISRRLMATLEMLLQGTPSRMSSTAFVDSYALLMLVCAASVLVGSLFFWVKGDMSFEHYLLAIVLIAALTHDACICLHTDLLGITAAPDVSLGEEAVGVLSFFIKLFIRAVPIGFGVGAIVGTVGLGIATILSMTASKSDVLFTTDSTLEYALKSGGIVFAAALVPLFAYFFSVFAYMLLDALRSILIIPGKLDRLAGSFEAGSVRLGGGGPRAASDADQDP